MQTNTITWKSIPWIFITICFVMLFCAIVSPQGANAGQLSEEAIQKLEQRANQLSPYRMMWTTQEKYEYQQLEFSLGITTNERIYGLPGENDMPEDVAITLAKRAVQLQHNISESIMGTYDGYCEFFVDNPAEPQWHISLIAKDDTVIDYRVEINAYTGRILLVYGGEEGWG